MITRRTKFIQTSTEKESLRKRKKMQESKVREKEREREREKEKTNCIQLQKILDRLHRHSLSCLYTTILS